MNLREKVGVNIKQFRKFLRMDQNKFSKRLKVSQGQVSKLENGKQDIETKSLKWMQRSGLDLNDIFFSNSKFKKIYPGE